METIFLALVVLCCGALLRADQLPYPLQLFYLAPNNVAVLPPGQQLMRSVPVHSKKEDDAMVEGEASQFHSQDSRGRALFGYTTPHQARIEARSEDGKVRGSYSYLDAWGKAVKVQYWDDGSGFHAAGNNLPGVYTDVPQPVQDTPEVTAAKEHHFLLFQQALAAAAVEPSTTTSTSKPAEQEGVDGGVVVVESDDTHVDEPPELTRYPNLQNFPQNLFDPTQVHDASRDAVIVDNPDIEPDNNLRKSKTLQVGPGGDPLATGGFFYSFKYPVPVYLQVKTVPEDNKLGVSVSQKAALFGAIPVAAVHDAQVPPYLRDSVKNFQVMPLYIETHARK